MESQRYIHRYHICYSYITIVMYKYYIADARTNPELVGFVAQRNNYSSQ